jgi:hypothetical protein
MISFFQQREAITTTSRNIKHFPKVNLILEFVPYHTVSQMVSQTDDKLILTSRGVQCEMLSKIFFLPTM